jgi:hypothetical protein
VYASTVNPRVRQQCAVALLKLVHFSPTVVLTQTLRDVPFSSFVATLLAAHDLALVVTGLQLAAAGGRKLPSILPGYYRREGVAYEMDQLGRAAAPVVARSPGLPPRSATSASPVPEPATPAAAAPTSTRACVPPF